MKMKWLLGILILATTVTPFDHLGWKTSTVSPTSTATLSTTAATAAASLLRSATRVLPAATSSASVSVTNAQAPASGATTSRLPDAAQDELPENSPAQESDTDDELPDYYDEDEMYEPGNRTHLVSESESELEGHGDYESPDYDDEDETHEPGSGDDGLPPSVNEGDAVEQETGRDGGSGEAASGGDAACLASEDDAVPEEGACSLERQKAACSAVGTRRGQESGADKGAGSGTAVAAPGPTQPINWISWLPLWCRYWPRYGPLCVPRETQLQAYSEALQSHTVGIKYYLSQPAQSDDDEQHSTENPQTNLITAATQQAQMLQDFYQWIFHQLTCSEGTQDCAPEALYSFLDALERQTDIMESICTWSPTTLLLCNSRNSSVYRRFFQVMDRQSLWMNLFTNWAVIQYNLGTGSRINPRWWLPTNLDEDVPNFNISQILPVRNQPEAQSSTALSVINDGVCSAEDIHRERQNDGLVTSENLGDLSPEANADSNFCHIQPQREQSENCRYQEGKLPTCVLRSLSVRDQESGESRDPENLPVREPETGIQLDRRILEVASALLQNELDATAGSGDVQPDQGSYDDNSQNVMVLQERERASVVLEEGEERHEQGDQAVPDARTLGKCSETPSTVMLGRDVEPCFLEYVKCDARDLACVPPEVCQAASEVVTVVMPYGHQLPSFPHSPLGLAPLPDGRVAFTLLVPTSCTCIEPLAPTKP